MFSSVRAGIAALPADVQACFITPADIPLVRPATIRRMANALAANTSGASIVYPLFAQRRGHPTLISRAVLNEVTHAPADARLSTLLAAHQHQSIDIFVPDQAILMDMDTPGDFARLRDLAELRGTHPELPTPAECEAILAFYQPDERVVRHTHIVAQVARSIAIALAAHDAARGIPAQPALVEPALVEAAALLHDVLKRTANAHPDHATAGAELLRQLEFPKVAAVVALHTDYPLPQSALSASSAWLPDEAAIVYLADKLVSADRILGLEQRFLRAFERFQHDPAALASARRRLAVAEAIFHHVEAHLGAALQPLIDAITPAELNPGAPNPDSPNQSSNQPQETDATHLSRP
jgi:putative nucleotidyltransferase with HDIG domain